jgi:succinoglycan biosynthesis protein ExoW
MVIVDDESPVSPQGELSDLLSQFPDRFKIIRQKNAGCFPANNTALQHVSSDTDFVACLDSDDDWEDCHLEHAVWALERGYDLFFSDFYQLNQRITAFNRAKRIDVAKHKRIHLAEPIHEYQGDMVNQIITGNIIGTSTVVYNFKKFRDLRYLQNFNHTGPEYIFWIALAAGSEKIAFSSIPECRYGGGVNIFSESSWGTDKFLSVRHEEIKWRMYLLRNVPLSDTQKASVIFKIQQSRLGFAKGLLHNLLHNGKVNGNLLVKHAQLDPKTFLLLPTLPARLVCEKLSGSLSRTTS